MVKIALESRQLNKQVHKNKFQIPKIEELMNFLGQTISERKNGDEFSTTMDGQLPQKTDTNKCCNFSLVERNSTGKYRFKTGFHGLTTMPAEIQRVMDAIPSENPCAHAFIDEILLTTSAQFTALPAEVMEKNRIEAE